MSAVLCLSAFAGAILAATIWIAYRQWLELREYAWLPEELKGATLEFAERLFHTKWPFQLFAKIDRAYRTADGLLVLTELKRRFHQRAYRSDVVELSAQKLAIERGARRSVATVGFVVIEHPATRKRTPIPVSLLREGDLVALRQRYRLLALGAVVPEKANDMRLCRSCAYADRCKPEVLLDVPASPIERAEATVETSGSSLQAGKFSAAAARAARPVRRRATGRSPGKSTTTVRSSPRSGRNHKA